MKPSNNRAVASAVVVAVVVLGLLASGAFLAGAKPTEDDLAKVKVGMSAEEVVKIMGKPDRDQKVREDELCRLFVYKSVGRYRIVNIWFDCSDKVRAIDKAR